MSINFPKIGFLLKPHCQSCDPNSISKIPALLRQTIWFLFRMGEGFVLDDRNIKINLIGKIQPTQVQKYILLIENIIYI